MHGRVERALLADDRIADKNHRIKVTGKLLLLWLAALPLMGSPGPATLSLAAVGSAFGASAGLKYLSGIIAGTFTVLLLIATGITGLILALPAMVWVITVLAAGYILYLAYKIATAPVLSENSKDTRAPSLASGFFLAVANPKAFAAIGAVYATHTVLKENLALDTAVKTLTLFTVIIVVNTLWLMFGSVFARFLRNPRAGRIANITFAILLVLSMGAALV